MQAQGSWPCPGKGLCCLDVPGRSPRLSQRVPPPALASVAAPQHAGHTHVGVSVHTRLGHVHVCVQRVLESPSSWVGVGGIRLHLQAQHWPSLRSGGGVGVPGALTPAALARPSSQEGARGGLCALTPGFSY